MKQNIFVTGVSGFVGRMFATQLLNEGANVHGFDLAEPSQDLRNRAGFSFTQGNLCCATDLDLITFDQYDYICHLAAAGVKASSREWVPCVHVNVLGSAMLLQSIKQKLGNSDHRPGLLYTQSFYEDHIGLVPALCQNPYILTKAAATRWIIATGSSIFRTIRIAKLFQVFGPGDDVGNVLSYAARSVVRGEQAIFGSGSGKRDWIYIDDLVRGLVACLKGHEAGIVHYDLGRGELISIRVMVEYLAELGGLPSNFWIFDPTRDRGDCEIVDWAKKMPSKWHPQVEIKEGLAHLLNSCEETRVEHKQVGNE